MIEGKIDWKEESERFDESATYYDKYRPSYPDEMIDFIINKTGISKESKIVEIGAGSGKATKLFAQKSLSMFCIEPGENLVKLGKKNFENHIGIEYHKARFEEWNCPEEAFDLAISAQAFHWVPKPIGYQKCAQTLKSGGFIGLFWNHYMESTNQVDKELLELADKYGSIPLFYLMSDDNSEKRIAFNINSIESSDYFKNVAIHKYPWEQTYTAEEYLGFLKTGNGYLSLNENERAYVEKEVIDIINRHGGTLTRTYICVLYLANKR